MADPPADHHNLVYLNFMYQGISVAFPWSVLITGQNYYAHRLARLPLARDFIPHFTIIFMTVKFVFLVSAMFFVRKIRPTWQIGIASVGNIVIFSLLLLTAAIDEIPVFPFYCFTLGLVLCASVFSSFADAGFYAILGSFPPSYTQGFIVGHGLSGATVVGLNLSAYLLTGNIKSRGFVIMYFGMSVVVMALSNLFIFLMKKSPVYRYYGKLGNIILEKHEPEAIERARHATLRQVLPHVWDLVLYIFLATVVGLFIYPNFVFITKSTHSGMATETAFHRDMFGQIAILVHSLAELAGKILPSIPLFAVRRPPFLLIAAFRMLFIPAFMLGNLDVHCKNWIIRPILANDYLFMSLNLVFGFVGGYFRTLCLMWAPTRVEMQNRAKVAALMIYATAAGLIVGSYSSFAVKMLFMSCPSEYRASKK